MKEVIEAAWRKFLKGSINDRNEVEAYDLYDTHYFIEFPTNDPKYAVVREYWANGNKESEMEYRNGKLNGKWLLWNEKGERKYKTEYRNDVKVKETKYKDNKKVQETIYC